MSVADTWLPFALVFAAAWLVLVALPCTVAWLMARRDRKNGAKPR